MSNSEAPLIDDVELNERDLAPSPFDQFAQWFAEAEQAALIEPAAMTLATASADGAPAARIVLLRSYDAKGFCFYTNYESDKARDLESNPRAALIFYWDPLRRQVRMTGVVEKLPRETSESYFATRPRGHQLAAWASNQSRVIDSRRTLEARVRELDERFRGGPVPLPPFWGGYRLIPQSIEFWQSRLNRLHDRFRYLRLADGSWRIERLAP
jgi:pyridoxamine 5'-phosphate oxidase